MLYINCFLLLFNKYYVVMKYMVIYTLFCSQNIFVDNFLVEVQGC